MVYSSALRFGLFLFAIKNNTVGGFSDGPVVKTVLPLQGAQV